jgi:hypothetical protein
VKHQLSFSKRWNFLIRFSYYIVYQYLTK